MSLRPPRLPNLIAGAKKIADISGMSQLADDARWSATHPIDRLMGRGRAQDQRMEIPWGPGGNAQFLKALAGLRKGVPMNVPLGPTGTTLRSVDATKYHPDEPFLSFLGNPKNVQQTMRTFEAGPREKMHLLQLIKNDAAHKKPGEATFEDLLGAFSTSSDKDWGHAIFQQAHIRPEMRGKGIFGEVAKARVAQAGGHLGFNPPVGGTFSNEALPAVRAAVKRGIIKPDYMTLDQIIHHAADQLPHTPRAIGHRSILHNLSEDISKQEPRWVEGAKTQAVPPQMVKHVLKRLETIQREYKGRH